MNLHPLATYFTKFFSLVTIFPARIQNRGAGVPADISDGKDAGATNP